MLRLLLLLLAAATAGAQHEEEEYVSMPATIGQRVPDRIVFNSRELSQCINDSTARRCILQGSGRGAVVSGAAVVPVQANGSSLEWHESSTSQKVQFSHSNRDAVSPAAVVPVQPNGSSQTLPACFRILVLWPAPAEPLVLDPDSWPQSFPQGVAEIKPSTLKASLTIASRPLSDSAAVSTQQQTLDFSKVPNAFLVQPGGRLTFSGLQLINLAAIWDYLYSTSQPYRSIARGRATWPSIGLAPNATVSSLGRPTCSRWWSMCSSRCPAQDA